MQVGDKVTFYPAQNECDNLHFPAVIEAIGSRIKIRVYGTEFPKEGAVKHVSKKRLAYQPDILAPGVMSK